jgi:hypothetical protein
VVPKTVSKKLFPDKPTCPPVAFSAYYLAGRSSRQSFFVKTSAVYPLLPALRSFSEGGVLCHLLASANPFGEAGCSCPLLPSFSCFGQTAVFQQGQSHCPVDECTQLPQKLVLRTVRAGYTNLAENSWPFVPFISSW